MGSCGCSGWTGTSIWIDPSSRTFVIFLSNRNHPTEEGSVIALRKVVSEHHHIALCRGHDATLGGFGRHAVGSDQAAALQLRQCFQGTEGFDDMAIVAIRVHQDNI